MKRFCSIALAIGLAATATAYLPASAQPPATTQHATLQMSAASRAQLIDTLIDAIANRYVFPEMAKNVARTLRAQQALGAYDKLADAQQLSAALTRDLQAVTGDRHLHVAYSARPIPVATPGGQPAPGEILRRRAMMQANNFGIDKIAHLPFNIGYLELTGFASAHEAAVTLAAAMTVVAHTDALIIDLRNNGGAMPPPWRSWPGTSSTTGPA